MKKYNQIVEKIVDNFVKRYYKEIYNEDEYDYRLMDYMGVNQGPIEIGDEYYNLDDIILAEHLEIPAKVVQDYNRYIYDLYNEGKEKNYNLYHYWKKGNTTF